MLFALLLLLAVAMVAGGYYGLRQYYLASEPVSLSLGQVDAAGTSDSSDASAAAPENTEIAKQRIDHFTKGSRRGEGGHSEFSAADINALIERNRKSRGAVAVAVEGETARVQTSIPLNRFDVPWQRALGLGDRYLNARFSVNSPPGGDVSNLHITDLVVNNHSIPGDALDFRIMGKTPRDYVLKYARKYNVSRVQIADGKVVLESGSGP